MVITLEALMTKGELQRKLSATKYHMDLYLEDGIPHYMFGNQLRFKEFEALEWLKTYKPSQEKLEERFRDKKGRTLEEYVSEETALATLRLSKVYLMHLCNNGMPFANVGEKKFFHMEDILDLYRRGEVVSKKAVLKKGQVERFLQPYSNNVQADVPFFIVDGSYSFDKKKAGAGIVLVENLDTATGWSKVRNLKTEQPNVCEFLAILEALRMVKSKNLHKAIIVTDQEHLTKGISIDENSYEKTIRPSLQELNMLWKDLKNRVEVKFSGQLNGGNKNVLYRKAHTLSQKYIVAKSEHLEKDWMGIQ